MLKEFIEHIQKTTQPLITNVNGSTFRITSDGDSEELLPTNLPSGHAGPEQPGRTGNDGADRSHRAGCPAVHHRPGLQDCPLLWAVRRL